MLGGTNQFVRDLNAWRGAEERRAKATGKLPEGNRKRDPLKAKPCCKKPPKQKEINRKKEATGEYAPISLTRRVKRAGGIVRPELWALVHGDSENFVIPFDCNEHEDEGCLVYFSKEAAEQAARHQMHLYGLRDVRVALLVSRGY